MKIRIVSNGDVLGTKVLHANTNEVLENVTAIEWRIDAINGTAEATLTIVNVPVDVMAFMDREEFGVIRKPKTF